jgi:protein-glutamine gamma-glutamyltransferase
MALVLVLSITALSLGALGWVAWQRKRQDPWSRLLTQMRSQLQHTGVQAQPQDSLRVLGERLTARHGAQAQAVVGLLEQLERWRYAPGSRERLPPAWLGELRRAVRSLRVG